MARPRRGWRVVGARARAARPDGPQTRRTPGKGAAAPRGAFPTGCRRPPPPSFPGPRRGSQRWRGAPAPAAGALAARRPHSPVAPPMVVTSRPRLCGSRLGLRVAARADQRRWGLSPGFRWPFLGGWIRAWIISWGARRVCCRRWRRGPETRFDGLARKVWSDASGAGYLASTRELPLLRCMTLDWEPPKKCLWETRSYILRWGESTPFSCLSFPICRKVGEATLGSDIS